jgi:hypothetical protein
MLADAPQEQDFGFPKLGCGKAERRLVPGFRRLSRNLLRPVPRQLRIPNPKSRSSLRLDVPRHPIRALAEQELLHLFGEVGAVLGVHR